MKSSFTVFDHTIHLLTGDFRVQESKYGRQLIDQISVQIVIMYSV